MISGWETQVAWIKENRWVINSATNFLIENFDEDIAIMIWGNYGENSLVILAEDDRSLLEKISRILCFFCKDKKITRMDKIKDQLKTEEGRKDVEMWLFNPWS